MFKWLKGLFTAEEVEQEVEATEEAQATEEMMIPRSEVERLVAKMNEKVEQMGKRLDQVSQDYSELQQRVMLESYLDLCRGKYAGMFDDTVINSTWKELAIESEEILAKRMMENPRASIKELCDSICEEKMKEVNDKTSDSARRICTEELTNRLNSIFSNMNSSKEIVKFYGKIMVCLDDLQAGKDINCAEQEAAATVEPEPDEDEFGKAIDSFVLTCSSMPPIPASEKEEPEIIDDADDEPNYYLTDDERRFIQISEQHPEYSPVSIFNMIHREKKEQQKQ